MGSGALSNYEQYGAINEQCWFGSGGTDKSLPPRGSQSRKKHKGSDRGEGSVHMINMLCHVDALQLR